MALSTALVALFRTRALFSLSLTARRALYSSSHISRVLSRRRRHSGEAIHQRSAEAATAAAALFPIRGLDSCGGREVSFSFSQLPAAAAAGRPTDARTVSSFERSAHSAAPPPPLVAGHNSLHHRPTPLCLFAASQRFRSSSDRESPPPFAAAAAALRKCASTMKELNVNCGYPNPGGDAGAPGSGGHHPHPHQQHQQQLTLDPSTVSRKFRALKFIKFAGLNCIKVDL